MKARQAIIVIIMMLVLASQCFAQTIDKAVVFTLSWKDGKYKISDVRVVLGKAPEACYKGEYLLKLKNKEGKTLYQTTVRKLNIKLEPSKIPNIDDLYITDENILALDYDPLIGAKEGMMFLMVPYVEEAKYLSFQHDKTVLAEYDLSELCNNNGICEETENYLSCKSDCKLNEKDGYCLHLKDSVCDPDCAEGLDIDCAQIEGKEGEKPRLKLPEEKLLYFFGAFIILVLAIYIWKKRVSKYG